MIPRLLIAALLAIALTGCAGKPKRVLNPGVTRSPVVYESPMAAEAFESSVARRYDRGDAVVKPLGAVLSKNAFFNKEAIAADTDLDGIISELEAYHYAEKSK
jgi:hypothetical protein